MNAGGSELLRAVLEAPDDDDARLVYADWLLEQGDPRGEFIQVQCLVGGSVRGAKAYRPKRAIELSSEELVAREKSLLKKHQKAWLEPFRAFVRTWTWKRGFVNSVEADAGKFLDGIATIVAHTPLERAVLTAMKPPLLAKLAATPEIERLRELVLGQSRIGPKTADVFHSRHFKNLRRLDIWGNPLGEDGGKILGAAQHLDSLKTIKLSTCELTAGAIDAISRAKFFPQLEDLDLRYNDGLGPTIGEFIGRGASLRVLDLTRAGIGDVGLERMLESKLENLEEVSFFGNDITLRGIKALVESKNVPKLRILDGLLDYSGGFLHKDEAAKLLLERFPAMAG